MSVTGGANGKAGGQGKAAGQHVVMRVSGGAGAPGQPATPPRSAASPSSAPTSRETEGVSRRRARPITEKLGTDGLPIAANARTVLNRRYQAKDQEGKVVETPLQMFQRVAKNLSRADAQLNGDAAAAEKTFFDMMARMEFLPNSPTIMNAGRELQQLSACFVLPVPDDMEAIFESAKHTAMIHKSGGGTGFSFSRLRPENDVVGSTGGIASGPVSFIKIFDTATDVVKQGGTRRGANMAILSVQHPDILKFIHAKDDDRSLQNFNISVGASEDFMKAVEAGSDYDLINPRSGKVCGQLNARKVFDEIVQSAWKTGDPGVVFLDRLNEPGSNPVPKRGPIEATNPCGEQPLYPYDSCNLGSINLARMVDAKGDMDWDLFKCTVTGAVHLLDNVVTMNRYPVKEIEEVSLHIRRIGLGVMGWADLLLIQGIAYDSPEALDLAERVMSFIQRTADDASEALAAKRGVFPDWEESVYGPNGAKGMRRLRNSTRTTIAPTGTISIIANCSSGIEPLFALSYFRTVMDNTKLVEVNPYFEDIARRERFYSPELMEELAERGTVRGMAGVPEWVQRVFVTAHDIAPEWHARTQAAFQKYTDNAVSKTVNFPHDATIEDVRTVYTLAYQLGCKGVTIYRDGSKSQQVLNTGQTAKAREEGAETSSALQEAETIAAAPYSRVPRERPATMTGLTHRIKSGHGNMYVTVNTDEQGKPFELFTTLGKAGGCDAAQLEAISRLASLALRAGVEAELIIEQLRGITCCPAWDNGILVRSAPDAVALALAKHLHQDHGVEMPDWDDRTMDGAQLGLFKQPQPETRAVNVNLSLKHEHGAPVAQTVKCPECGNRLSYEEGCLMCHSCGFNKCG